MAPIRRPIARKWTDQITESVAAVVREDVQPRLAQVELGISHARTEVGTYRNETNLVLDSLVRELSRLQDQVEMLQHLVIESAERRERLLMVGREEKAPSAA
jgi:hypothetical protein